MSDRPARFVTRRQPASPLLFLSACLLTGAVVAGGAYYALTNNGISIPQILSTTQTSIPNTPIGRENTQAGDTYWVIAPGHYAAQGEIAGYSLAVSANLGQTMRFAVSTRVPDDSYSFKVYRLGYYGGKGARLMTEADNQHGAAQGYFDETQVEYHAPDLPQNCPTCITSYRDALGQETNLIDANWAVTQSLTIPTYWVSGVYLVLLTTAEGKQNYIPFIVRDDARPTPYLMQIDVSTWQAYNSWGGFNSYGMYNGQGIDVTNPARIISYNRPYVAAHGSFALFYYTEYNMLRFLERGGYDVTYTTNIDVSAHPELLSRHKSLIIAGHDEYWDATERDGVISALHNGIDLLVFAGNEAYKQVRYEPDSQGNADRWQVFYHSTSDPAARNPTTARLTTLEFRLPPVSEPENSFIGVEWTAGGTENQNAQQMDMIFTNTNLWAFANTNLRPGDRVQGIVGYESDSLVDNGATPPHVIVVADSPAALGTNPQHSQAIVRYPTAHSFEFDGATIDWSDALDGFNLFWPRNGQNIPVDPRLQQLMRNLLAAVVIPSAFHADAARLHG